MLNISLSIMNARTVGRLPKEGLGFSQKDGVKSAMSKRELSVNTTRVLSRKRSE